MKKLITFFALIISQPALADFSTALNLYSSGNFEGAYEEFLTMAKAGEKRSQFNLGVMYYQGQHVNKDINKAYAWLKLAVDSDTITPEQRKAFAMVASDISDKSKAEQEYSLLSQKYATSVLIDTLYPEFIKPENSNAVNAQPVDISEPRYPKKAAQKRQQGWVRFQFDLDRFGVPRNILLLESFPEQVFVRAAAKSIKKWRFKPALNKDKQPVMQPQLRYTMSFRLAGSEFKIKDDAYRKTKAKAVEGDASAQFKLGYWHNKSIQLPEKLNPNEWFLKAAIQGSPEAQFELGRSLVYGHGCKTDKNKGVEWLTRSAASGQPDARQLLGSLAAHVDTLESHQMAVEYFKGEDKLLASAKLDYAWMLATSRFPEIADPERAIDIVDSFSSSRFWDNATKYEIKAAAYAALGNFNKAVKLQQQALSQATSIKADVETIATHLDAYKASKKWF